MPKTIEGQIECPFYLAEGKSFISCEGILNGTKSIHRFESDKDKVGYENNVCCINGGKACPHYKIINSLYERGVRA